ncbi:sigma 54-interacting transcriptional regulator [Seohaeicola sp. SP36]|jgi:PAS domain S-box-containing protein|uniref:sigma-54 interaction domain-containing protein n=1 Tax=unclassified Seohaeicola TaxID=2641111 RepID=UPI00237C1DC8|nr:MULTISPECIES: sigma 54-interacting transcriptional regulator [unclassified Seohaeicola]MDD9708376.1 sigma 54-interacting transcriptional regulator [Seohaeicola sp. 4SK31]MDD9736470.1 sigma 54-interacting transcriptional regulator [Seohaeicola sp. SP36]MDF1707082.1 sigma 54-interacting transcriptional regulator [Paracoccaceae bacterium]
MLDLPTRSDSLLNALAEAALLIDLVEDRIRAANSRARRLLDLPDADGTAFSPLVGATLPQFIVFVDEIAHRSEAWSRDITLATAKSAPLRCEIRGRLVEDSPSLLLLTVLDLDEMDRHDRITEAAELHRSGLLEWRRAQGFFSELERQNQLILNAAGEGIYGVNADGKTTFLNRAAQEMLGWTAEDLLGHDIHSVIHHHHLNGETYHSHDCPIYQSFRFEQVARIEDEVFWRKDGKPIRVEYVSTPIYDQKVLAGAVVIFRDITERKENERKLREAMEEVAALRDRLEQENAYLQEAITSERAHHDIIGRSPAIRQLLTKIGLVAPTDATVLITGEAGTGKALVATAIHSDSPRRRRPLIHFKCGAVTADATEAELFGQMRGAFPGALRDKPGKLELAHGGTLFLDDVSELPLEQQGRLLHALQAGEVTRLGDTRTRQIDIRVIAATTKNLEHEVAAGRMREDLWLFLNVFPVTCTPLRDRRDDIPELAAHLLDIACKRMNRPRTVITERMMERLCAYPWPGNVRELKNVIERAAILSTGGKLMVELGTDTPVRGSSAQTIRTEAEIQQAIRDNIVACLRETNGKVSGPDGAAALLGVQPTTLYSRIRKFRISAREIG